MARPQLSHHHVRQITEECIHLKTPSHGKYRKEIVQIVYHCDTKSIYQPLPNCYDDDGDGGGGDGGGGGGPPRMRGVAAGDGCAPGGGRDIDGGGDSGGVGDAGREEDGGGVYYYIPILFEMFLS